MQQIRHLLFIIALLQAGPAMAAIDLNASLTLTEARHLLSRTGFGASAHQLNNLIGQSKSTAINTIVDGLSPATTTPVPDWVNQPAPHNWSRNQLSQTARREFNEARYREIQSLRLWWVSEMIQTTSPQTERLVLAWHNHFATSYTSINDQAVSIARQHMMFRKHGTGNFRTLLKAIIHDPAMLNYLDNDNSHKNAPNENLARELLELFSLGEGNYTENDIKNAARALTGYSTAPTRNHLFQFKDRNHDTAEKTLFGNKGHFNGNDVVDQILNQPAAAEFVARKFWKILVSDQPPTQQQIEPLANTFRESDYDIKTLYKATLNSEAFWSAVNRATIVQSPVSLTIGTIRSTGSVPDTWQVLPNVVAQLGQQLFDPPNVAGWPGARAWITPSRLLNRLEWLRTFDQNCDGANCDPTMMGSMSTMADPAMQMDSGVAASDEKGLSSDDLVIRLASEEFDGPVIYRVTVTRGDMILWTSGKTPLPGGYDTKRYGRKANNKALPWRNVSFSLPARAQKFDAIEVEYLNDKNQQGAQQNLYVDWASYKQKLYSAGTGKQTNSCPRRKNARHGTLLCNGKVRLSKAVAPAGDNAAGDAAKLSVGGLYLWAVDNPDNKKNFSSISFTLTDVQLGDRQWHTLTVLYGYRAKHNQYSLRLNTFGCWPDCVEQWPSCHATATDEKSAMQRLIIELAPKTKNQCPYDSLTDNDKKLINSLWSSLPELYRQSKSNPKLNRGSLREAHDAWSPHVSNIEKVVLRKQQLQQRLSDAEYPAKLALQLRTPTNNNSITPTHTKTPLADGRTALQQQQDMQTLLANNPDANLASLLLPGDTNAHNADNLSLTDVLTDLAFQLK